MKIVVKRNKVKGMEFMKNLHSYDYFKWLNLIGFALLYNTVYIGRFNLNNVLPEIAAECHISNEQAALISGSVFITYAIGSLLNGRLVDHFKPRIIILIGTSVSILCNLLIAQTTLWQLILLLWLINGYFQSMIWISGICLITQWWSSKERGFAGGLINFFSGISHVTAYVFPIAISIVFPFWGWKGNFVVPMVFMTLFLFLFWVVTMDSPAKVGMQPYIETNEYVALREENLRSEIDQLKGNSWKYFFSRPKFLWWCGIATLSSLCRYGLLKWIPLYYAEDKGAAALLSPTFSNLILPLGMAFGTLILTWITGKKLNRNKGIMVVTSAALCGTVVIIFPTIQYSQVVLMGIFCTGFFLYGINGILWIYAMDRGGRLYSGTAAGILNCFAYFGAALEAFIFPNIVRLTNQTISIFIVMELICIAMVICGMVVTEKDTTMEAEEKINKK